MLNYYELGRQEIRLRYLGQRRKDEYAMNIPEGEATATECECTACAKKKKKKKKRQHPIREDAFNATNKIKKFLSTKQGKAMSAVAGAVGLAGAGLVVKHIINKQGERQKVYVNPDAKQRATPGLAKMPAEEVEQASKVVSAHIKSSTNFLSKIKMAEQELDAALDRMSPQEIENTILGLSVLRELAFDDLTSAQLLIDQAKYRNGITIQGQGSISDDLQYIRDSKQLIKKLEKRLSILKDKNEL